MKKSILLAVYLLCSITSQGQTDSIDTRAVVLLDRMSNLIGELKSCSFKLESSDDKDVYPFGTVREFYSHQVYAVGPNKFHVHTKGPKETHAYWYNGDLLMYYSMSYNQYGFLESYDNIMETIEMMNEDYGIDFPAADFFYPTFSDDLIEHSSRIAYLGLVNVNGSELHHILSKNEKMHIQIWLSNDTYTLPMRFTITQFKANGPHFYEGVFSDWKINPDLPDALFDFVVPQSASLVQILSKTSLY